MKEKKSNVLGIIAGAGQLPCRLVEACKTSGRECFVLAIEDSAEISTINHVPYAVVRLGAIGEALNRLRQANVVEIVMAGKIHRPAITALRPDMAGAKLLAKLGTAFFSGDDALLKAIVAFLEEEDFRIVGADDILGALMAPEGILGKVHPDKQARTDISRAIRVAKMIGELDVGQAVIVEDGYVLGIEAAEGTDGLIDRCKALKRQEKRCGVLVKAKKPLQETRVDLPAIGTLTVVKVHAAGFAGIAVEANACLILDLEEVIHKADELGIFVAGVHNE